MNRLDGKVALISGAARGIGAETARLMAGAGARVIIGDILDERGRGTARDIGGGDSAAIFHPLDVTSEEDWKGAIGAVIARWGGLDILVNNAGLFLGKGIEEVSLEEWNRLCAVNLTGVFLGTKLAVPSLRDRGRTSPHGSAIVNLASVAGLVGSLSLRPNSASRFASQQQFQRVTVSTSAGGSSPRRAASAGRLSAVLIQPFASSALLSSLQS